MNIITDHLMTVLFSFATACVLYFYGKIKGALEQKRRDEEEATHNLQLACGGLKSLLYYRLVKEMERCIHQGYKTMEDITNIDFVITPYKGLKGNGRVEALYQEFLKLKIVSEEDYNE